MTRLDDVSHRAWLLAAFVALAMVLGGGGSYNPSTELALQLGFAAAIVAWAWMPGGGGVGAGGPARADRRIVWLLAIPLALPLVQLVPLPPSVWTALPGRADTVAALELVGEAQSWRPISLSPARTLAALLAVVPPLFCLYATASMTLAERRLVLSAIAGTALLAGLLGLVQLVAPGDGISLYDYHHQGWITGFQASRNAAADVFLVALLAVAALAVTATDRQAASGRRGSATRLIVLGGAALFLAAATVMTGSRAGLALLGVALVAGGAMLAFARDGGLRQRWWLLPAIAAAIVASLAAVLLLGDGGGTGLGRVIDRFSSAGNRAELWEDTRYAIALYWPVGVGMGVFEPIAFAVERLEVLEPRYPNRAHNDFLELALEAGALGYAALTGVAAMIAILAWTAWSDSVRREQVLFALAVLAILALHSLVDYPLRSMALACLAGVAAGMLARPPHRHAAPSNDPA